MVKYIGGTRFDCLAVGCDTIVDCTLVGSRFSFPKVGDDWYTARCCMETIAKCFDIPATSTTSRPGKKSPLDYVLYIAKLLSFWPALNSSFWHLAGSYLDQACSMPKPIYKTIARTWNKNLYPLLVRYYCYEWLNKNFNGHI